MALGPHRRLEPRQVVVTSAAILSPLAEDPDGLCEALMDGRSGVRRGANGVSAAWLDSFELEAWTERHLADDPARGAHLRRVAGRAARPVQTAVCVATAALRGAESVSGQRTGFLIAGANLALEHHASSVLGYDRRPGGLLASYALTHMDVDVTGAVSEVTGIHREGWSVGGGSAAGALAVGEAFRLITTGVLDCCLVVAPVAELAAAELEAFVRAGAMADVTPTELPAEVCRPFDVDRRGFVYGQAAAAVLLEHAGTAAARGAAPIVEVVEYGQTLDGRRGTEPNSDGQLSAIRQALDVAGVAADEVDYVNTHGTGSVLGDAIEARTLGAAFGVSRPLVNSTKPFTGHCLSAAGVVELIATLLQMKAGVCHPNLNLHEPISADVTFAGPEPVARSIRVAMSTNYAFGGINAALLLRRIA